MSFRQNRSAGGFGGSARQRLVAVALGGLAVAFVPPLAAGQRGAFGNEAWQAANEGCQKNELPRLIKHRWKCRKVPSAYSGTVTLQEHAAFTACAFHANEDIRVSGSLDFRRGAIPRWPPHEDGEAIKYHTVGAAKLSASKNARYNGSGVGCTGTDICTIDSSSSVKVDSKHTELAYYPAYGTYEIEVIAGEEASQVVRCPGGSEAGPWSVPSVGADGVTKSALAIFGERKEQPPNQPDEHHWVKTVWNFPSKYQHPAPGLALARKHSR